MTPLRTFSYGGGVQSTAALVLAAQGKIDFPVFLFCNVGDDSEDPATLEYVRDVAIPYAKEHGVELHVIQRERRDGTSVSLMETILSGESRNVPIPTRAANGAPGKRGCTDKFKIKVMGKWLKAHGATPDNPAIVGIGISTDEFQRAGATNTERYRTIVYPLLDLRINRGGCEEVIRRSGIPVPPKSACFFCPFHGKSTWAEMRRDRPVLFRKSADLEQLLNERREEQGKPPVWLTRFNKPLEDAVAMAQDELFGGEPETCDAFSCFT